MLIIGDVHGKVHDFEKLVCNQISSVQLGDFGFKKSHDWFMENMDLENNKILFGNHDFYPYLYEKYSLFDYDFNSSKNMFFVRGANSIDKQLRTEGLDWFSNEEISYSKFQEIIEDYESKKPRIVISHDCPQVVRQSLFGINEKSTTSNGLQAMFEIHQPDLWIFGHHHKSKNVKIETTNFRCLAELEVFEI